jgi:tetratricopeptide (TPR) repeat protein
MLPGIRVVLCVCALAALSGCGAHRKAAANDAAVPLEAFIAKIRELSVKPRPPAATGTRAAQATQTPTLEGADPELVAARVLLTTAPTAENHRRVAEAYARLGVRDVAYDHFAAALRLNARDAASYDGLARIWRDWGMPDVGIGHAYRAIYYAPDSPAARNTLGTILVRMGQFRPARAAFERALALEPGAAYLLNNLCYATLLDGDRLHAVDRCQRAVAADPALNAARNNLALAYAASGDFGAASREFLLSGDAAAERYNMGVALMATKRYDDAAAAFEDAAALRPWLTLARERAHQARNLAAAAAPQP